MGKRFIYLAKLGIIESVNENGEFEVQRIDDPIGFQERHGFSFEPPLLSGDKEALAVYITIPWLKLEELDND